LISNSKIMQCTMGPVKVYSCPSGGSLSGSNCISTVTQAASIGSYTCASGTLSGSNCIGTATQAASIGSYTCSSGTLSGSNCISTGTQAASIGSYTCASGTLSGSSCITGSSAAATANYSCPAGTSLSGTSCNGSSTASTPGTPYYSCPAGTTLSGSSCTAQGTATAAATAAWTCPNGGTLSGISCVGAISRTRYEAYGNTAAGTIPNGIGFTGHVNDPDTGLVYMQQRYYDPIAGRFMSLDPLVTDGNTGALFNRYNYANNNPYRFTDPDGRLSCEGQISCEMIVDNGENERTPGRRGLEAAHQVGVTASKIGEAAVEEAGWWGLGGLVGKFAQMFRFGATAAKVEQTVATTAKVEQAIAAKESLGFARSQLQHGFKHAKDFGVTGNANNKTLAEFGSVLQAHVGAAETQAIQGTYRGNPVTHLLNTSTGLNVIRDSSGNFLSGWKLSPQQLQHVVTTGKLGGG